MKFKIKEGYPKLSVIYKGVKYVLADLDELPDDVYKYAIKGNYGIVKKEKQNGNSNSS